MESDIRRRCSNKIRPTEAEELGFSTDIQIQCLRDANGHSDHESVLLDRLVKWIDYSWPA